MIAKMRVQLGDWMRNSVLVWRLHAAGLIIQSTAQRHLETRLLTLAQAYRRWPLRWLERRLSPWLTPQRGVIWREHKIGWNRYRNRIKDRSLIKSIVLKAPCLNGEKGVLYVAFEYNWLRLLEHHNLSSLMRDYLLVCASTCSPPDFAAHWALAHVGPDPIFMQISNPSDMNLYSRFSHNIRAIPIMASDWMNPNFYHPIPHEQREIDLLMVAGWGRVKRHWLLFEALPKMRRGLRVVLIGQDMDGRTADDVYCEARLFGVADRIEIVRDASIGEVAEYQCNSKASVILSAREGSCVVVSESLFADAPVALLHDAHVGALSYINDQTGILLHRRTLAAQLEALIDHSSRYTPRRWAEANIACVRTTGRLNRILQDYSSGAGMPWTHDIAPMCRHPNPMYVNQLDGAGLARVYSDLLTKYGIAISPFT